MPAFDELVNRTQGMSHEDRLRAFVLHLTNRINGITLGDAQALQQLKNDLQEFNATKGEGRMMVTETTPIRTEARPLTPARPINAEVEEKRRAENDLLASGKIPTASVPSTTPNVSPLSPVVPPLKSTPSPAPTHLPKDSR